MTRIFRAKLANGKNVNIQASPSAGGTIDELLADQRILEAMINSDSTSESELITFLAHVLPVVIPEMNAKSGVVIARGARELGFDLSFELEDNSGLGVLQIKSPRYSIKSNPASTRDQVLSQYNSAKAYLRKPIRAAYVIAGRTETNPKNIHAIFQNHKSVRVLSWDDVCARLGPAQQDQGSPEFKVILIELVDASRRLLKFLCSNSSLLFGIDDRQFEQLMATLFHDVGFEDVELTQPRKDGGRDIVLSFRDKTSGLHEVLFCECKHWVSGNKVTARWALSLLEVSKKHSALGGVLISSSGFGPKLLQQEAEFEKQGIYLKDNHKIQQWLQVWEKQYGSVIMQPVDPMEFMQAY